MTCWRDMLVCQVISFWQEIHFEDTDDTKTTQHVQNPTHERGHMLDICISRADTCLQGPSVECLISDHHIIQSSLIVGRPAFPCEKIPYGKIRSIDNTAFALYLMATDLLQNSCVTLHGLVDQHNSTLSRIIDEYAPLKTKTLIIRPDALWISTDILEARKVRRQLQRHWMSTRLTAGQWSFQRAAPDCQNMIFTAKSLFHTTQINEHSTDLKSLFRVTSSMLGMKKVTVLPKHDTAQWVLCAEHRDNPTERGPGWFQTFTTCNCGWNRQ